MTFQNKNKKNNKMQQQSDAQFVRYMARLPDWLREEARQRSPFRMQLHKEWRVRGGDGHMQLRKCPYTNTMHLFELPSGHTVPKYVCPVE